MPSYSASLRGKVPDELVDAIAQMENDHAQLKNSVAAVKQKISDLPSSDDIRSASAQLQQAVAILPSFALVAGGSSAGLQPQASVLPALSTGLLYNNATANTVIWYSTGLKIPLPNGQVVPVPDTTVGSPLLSVSGLTPATYYFYPYFNISMRLVLFAQVSGGVGTPPAAYTAKSISAAQIVNGDGNVGLAVGSSIAAASTGGGGGGGGGGGSGCLRSRMFVETSFGPSPLSFVQKGMDIFGPQGWTQIKAKKTSSHDTFLRFTLHGGEILDMTDGHPVHLYREEEARMARTLGMNSLFRGKSVPAIPVMGIERIETPDTAELIECSPSPWFYVGTKSPSVAMHNALVNK